MELKGSKTEANLWKAFAGESQARNKYTYFASTARKEGYEQRENENLQVFPDTVTRLDLEMIPLSELPGSWDKVSLYTSPPQNL